MEFGKLKHWLCGKILKNEPNILMYVEAETESAESRVYTHISESVHNKYSVN